jgi:hypothetical protein
MVQNHDRMFSHCIEIGEANQPLRLRVKRWCRQIDGACALRSGDSPEESVNSFILDRFGSNEEAAR